ncbi:MAG: hypothetical protein DRP01_09385, partial [Archaeoglobales archaeon]
MIEVTRITIRNFKNLKDVTIKPKKFNVLIGPNGSGKTNFLEFFKLLRKIYVERNPYPFLEWDGYENVVWNHKRSLPIEFEIETVERITLTELIDVKETDLHIEVFYRIFASLWADRGENLKILKESVGVEIPKLKYRVLIERNGEIWKVNLNDKEYKIGQIECKDLHLEISEWIKTFDLDTVAGFIDDVLLDIIKELPKNAIESFNQEIKERLHGKGISTKKEIVNMLTFREIDIGVFKHMRKFLTIPESLKTIYQPLLALFKMIVFFPLNIQEIKCKQKIIPKDDPLSEGGENVFDILVLIQLRENKLPKRIEYFVENYFNGKLYFKGIAPGRLNLYLYDLNNKTEFSKEHLPDGLIKLLVILTALEQNPSILLIDEIENSLHPELLEFIINVLREECEGCIFVTTHSPIVLNLVEPEEIF